MSRIVLFTILLITPFLTFSQKKIKLVHADSLKGSKQGEKRFERLLGHVAFVQNTTNIFCDSAYFFRSENRLEAFGHVHITDDSVDITSIQMEYDGTKKIARLRKTVVFEKLKIAKLYTDFLDYYRIQNEARYFNGGKLVDTTNVLTSKKGYYDVRTNLASFKKDVVGVNPDYTLTSDTLQYNSKTRLVYFRDFTTLKDKEGKTANYQNGVYDTRKKISTLTNGEMESPTYRIKGDDYFINDVKKFYKVKGHVAMTSKAEHLTIFGDDGFYDRKNGISKVYGNAYMARVMNSGDTLFLTADTLVSIENVDPKKKRLLAYHKVKIYKSDMQGIADSLVYKSADSTLYFFRDPVLWSDENQMTADSIHMLLKNRNISRIYMVSNSFVVSQDSLLDFNQIKGRRMTTYFENSQIHHVIVEGNGESIYHALEEKEIKKDSLILKITFLAGMNKIICSNMRIDFKAGKVNSINFYVKPDASFFPPQNIKKEDQRLKGFTWRGTERPKRKDVVKREPVEIKKPEATTIPNK
ncbi:MAG TPA: OstA-like protein [Cyclobacteriaceae bacterium]|jgi:lipopolysaccharide export system protein LptA|nr:OstA-like protein [Cyclobacteriaceae bacterium]